MTPRHEAILEAATETVEALDRATKAARKLLNLLAEQAAEAAKGNSR